MDNAFVCLKTVIFRSVLSVLVVDVEDMATKALHGLLEGFYHSLQGLSFGFFDSDGITILISSCLPRGIPQDPHGHMVKSSMRNTSFFLTCARGTLISFPVFLSFSSLFQV